MKNSYRIQKLIQAVPSSASVLDVGCDHGLVSLGLAERSDIQRILATDISAASLQKLQNALPGLSVEVRAKITTCVADGLVGIPWEKADAVVIAGMGGSLMCRILAVPQVRSIWESAQLILLPHNDTAAVRKFLLGQRFAIDDEWVFFDGGHYYEILQARPLRSEETVPAYTSAELQYGAQPLRRCDPALCKHLMQQIQEYRMILQNLPKNSESAQVRRINVEHDLNAAQQIFKWLEGTKEESLC